MTLNTRLNALVLSLSAVFPQFAQSQQQEHDVPQTAQTQACDASLVDKITFANVPDELKELILSNPEMKAKLQKRHDFFVKIIGCSPEASMFNSQVQELLSAPNNTLAMEAFEQILYEKHSEAIKSFFSEEYFHDRVSGFIKRQFEPFKDVFQKLNLKINPSTITDIGHYIHENHAALAILALREELILNLGLPAPQNPPINNVETQTHILIVRDLRAAYLRNNQPHKGLIKPPPSIGESQHQLDV